MLPNNNTPWPPRQLRDVSAKMAEWSAWYGGDHDRLIAAYGGNRPVSFHRSQYAGGVVGAAARFWWGPPNDTVGEADRIRLHIPVAADICQASSDLLFADPPNINSADELTSKRLQDYLDDGLVTRLAKAAELVAALGGGYLRTSWDRTVSPFPFTTTIDADAAYPEFTWGLLSALTAWWKWSDGSTVYRQLERHTTDANGIGIVEHALYQGNGEDLGRRVPLDQQQRTAGLALLVDANSRISTRSPGLAVTYVPNLPTRRWRDDPIGAHLGRSDLDGIEPLMDALDRTYSSWMRDIDLGKGRVIVPDWMLDVRKPGQGVTFDLDREVFTGVGAAPNTDRFDLQVVQFSIRVQEHKETAQQLMEDILRSAGYSAQTFGEDDTGGAATATEITSRERRSTKTRARKIREWKPAVAEHVRKLLAVDAAVFGARVTTDGLLVQFADSAQDSPLELATTAEMLKRAGAASIQTLVAMVHPNWDQADVDTEATRIVAESGVGPLSDPAALGAGGFGL